jgi:hypothetical protein
MIAASLARAIGRHVDAALARVRVARWGTVAEVRADGRVRVDYDAPEERVVSTGQVVAVAPPRSAWLRVLWPSGGGRSLAWGLAKGDRVLTVGVDRVLGTVLRFQAGYDVVLPVGDLPPGATRNDGQPVVRLPSGEALRTGSGSASQALAVAPALRQELDALWTAIGNHVHTVAGVQPGSGSVVSAPSGTTPVTRDIASRRIVTDDTVVAGVGVTG